MLTNEETLRLKLALRHAITEKGLRVSPKALAALEANILARGYLATFHEDGAVTFTGESLGDALETIKSSPEGSTYFEAAPAAPSAAPKSDGNKAAVAVAQEKFGYSPDEWSRLSYIKKSELVTATGGVPTIVGNESWRKTVAKVAMDPAELAKLSPEEKIRRGNESARPAGWA